MRWAVFHNPTAGEGDWPEARLVAVLREAGIEADYHSVKEEGWREALEAAASPVLVAGGDGTVERVACLAGRNTDLVVLPTGGANNTNRWFGGDRDVVATVRALVEDDVDPLPLHICRVRGANGAQCFIESVGVGALPRSILAAKDDDRHKAGESKVARGCRVLRECLRDAQPVCCRFVLDGVPVEEEALMVEVLNTGMIGPNLALHPANGGTEDQLVVAWLPLEQRDAMADWLGCSGRRQPPLRRRRAERVELRLDGEHIHVADDVLEDLSGSVVVERAGPPLHVLVPRKATR